MNRSILYADNIILDKNIIVNPMIYIETLVTHKSMKSIKIHYKQEETDISLIIEKINLIPFHFSIIDNHHDQLNLWQKITNHMTELSSHPDTELYLRYFNNAHLKDVNNLDVNMLDGFLYGYISYISLFALLENVKFKRSLPIQFQVPVRLEDGDCSDYHVFQYIYQPLNAMMQILDEDTPLYNYFNVIIGFINIWSPVFHSGPGINANIINTLNMEIMTGVTNYYIKHLKNIRRSKSDSKSETDSKTDKIYNDSKTDVTSGQSDKIYYNVKDKTDTSDSKTDVTSGRSDKIYYNVKDKTDTSESKTDIESKTDTSKTDITSDSKSNITSGESDKIYYNVMPSVTSESEQIYHGGKYVNNMKSEYTTIDSSNDSYSIEHTNSISWKTVQSPYKSLRFKKPDTYDTVIAYMNNRGTQIIQERVDHYMNTIGQKIIANEVNKIVNQIIESNDKQDSLELTTGMKY